jgi:hypothetical protein
MRGAGCYFCVVNYRAICVIWFFLTRGYYKGIQLLGYGLQPWEDVSKDKDGQLWCYGAVSKPLILQCLHHETVLTFIWPLLSNSGINNDTVVFQVCSMVKNKKIILFVIFLSDVLIYY